MLQVEKTLGYQSSRAKKAGCNSLKEGVKTVTHLLGGRIACHWPIKRKRPPKSTLVAKRPHKCVHHERYLSLTTSPWL